MAKDYGTPRWQIRGDGGDFSAYLSRMTSLTITDEIGMDSDKLAITLEDDDPEHDLPAKDAEITARIGWEGEALTDKGVFKYDSCNLAGPARTMTLNFTAADMKGELKARRSASYINKSLREIVSEVAGRNNIKPKFVGDIPDTKIPQVHQTSESDMAFVLRLAQERDLFAKPSFGQLVVGKPGAGQDNVHEIDISEITEWTADLQARSSATKVKARVEVLEDGVVKYVEEGGEDSGGKGGAKDVTRELLQSFRSEEEAKQAAKASLDNQNRGAGTITILMPGNAKFFAEDHINIKGFSVKVDGKWRLTSVVDKIDADNWSTTLSGERTDSVMSDEGGGKVVQFPLEGGGMTPGGR